MSAEWNAVFAKIQHPYNDRHWLWQVFPELYPLPPGRTTAELKCQRYVCSACAAFFPLEEFGNCPHIPKYASCIDLSQQNLRGLAVRFAELAEPQIRVFDAGCGTGSSCFPLLEKNGEAVVTAVDFSPAAVQQLQQRPYYDATKLTVFVADLLKLEETETYDFVMANFVLSSIADVPNAIFALNRLLGPKGTLLLLDYEKNDYRIERRFSSLHEFGLLCEREDKTILLGFDVEKLEDFLKSIGLRVYEATSWDKEERNRKTGEHFVRKHFIIKAGRW